MLKLLYAYILKINTLRNTKSHHIKLAFLSSSSSMFAKSFSRSRLNQKLIMFLRVLLKNPSKVYCSISNITLITSKVNRGGLRFPFSPLNSKSDNLCFTSENKFSTGLNSGVLDGVNNRLIVGYFRTMSYIREHLWALNTIKEKAIRAISLP